MDVLKQTSPQAEARAPKPSPWNTELSSRARIAFIVRQRPRAMLGGDDPWSSVNKKKAWPILPRRRTDGTSGPLRLPFHLLQFGKERLRPTRHVAEFADFFAFAIQHNDRGIALDPVFLLQRIVRPFLFRAQLFLL